jgi:hypothetical protein
MRTINRMPQGWELCSRMIGLCSISIMLMSFMGIRSDASGESMDFAAATLKAEARGALHYYLNLDCGVAPLHKKWTPGPLERLMRISKDEPEIETRLVGFLRSGPNTKESEAISRALEDEWSELKGFLDQKPELGLQPDDLRVLQRVMDTKETYIKRGLDRIQEHYRQRSAIALLAMADHGSATANRALHEIMETGSTESKAAIRAAGERLTPSSGSRLGH